MNSLLAGLVMTLSFLARHALAGYMPDTAHPHTRLAAINWVDLFHQTQPAYLAWVINFSILCALYWGLGRTPVAQALYRYRHNIQEAIREAQQLKQEAVFREKQYQAKLNQLEEEIQQLRKELVAIGQAKSAQILSEAEAQAARMVQEAMWLAEQTGKQAAMRLLAQEKREVCAQATQWLQHHATDEDQQRLADRYLAQLEASL